MLIGSKAFTLILATVDYLILLLFLLSDNVDLGTACGKYYRVCCLSIIDPGNANGIGLVCDLIFSSPSLIFFSFVHMT